ncbi:MAG: hypothetical protein PHD11_06920 [Bacteroidales bacterium]|nr:hypothetical protein [Bacteroidales bacterium]MDD4671042.1 hypothetical protein [Bacteroidales bacterium]
MLKSDYEVNQVHIGNLIKQVVDGKGISYQEFAKKLHCERSSVYYLFRCKSIDIDKLVNVSNALNYNFIENIYVAGSKSSAVKQSIAGHNVLMVSLTEEQEKALKKMAVKSISASELKDIL